METDFTKNFRASSRVVRSYEFVEQHLGGAGVWDILIPAPAEIDWDFLERLGELERQLRTITIDDDRARGDQQAGEPGLTKVLSVYDVVDAATLGNLRLIPLPALRDRAVREALAQVQTQMPEFYHALVTRDPRDPSRSLVRVMLRSRERQESAAKQRLIADVERTSRAAFDDPSGDRLLRAADEFDPKHDARSMADVRPVDRRNLADDAVRVSQPDAGRGRDRAQHAAGVHGQRTVGLAGAEDQHGLGHDRGRFDGPVGRFVGPLHHGVSRASRRRA